MDLSPKKKTFSSNREYEIKPGPQKYILPKSLFNIGKNKKTQKENKIKGKSESPFPPLQSSSAQSTSKLINQLYLLSKLFIPKYKIVSVLLINNPSFLANNNNKNIPVNNRGNKNKNFRLF